MSAAFLDLFLNKGIMKYLKLILTLATLLIFFTLICFVLLFYKYGEIVNAPNQKLKSNQLTI